jgi:hypothetical protein
MRNILILTTLIAAAFAAEAKAGTGVLRQVLQACHGADGTPNPAIAKMMKVEMKDLK